MGAGHSSCCSDPSPAIPLQAGASRAAPHMVEGQHGWCPGGNCRVDKSLPSSTALLQISDFCSKLFIYGKNHFFSQKLPKLGLSHRGNLQLRLQAPIWAQRALSEEHQFPAQPSRRSAWSCLSEDLLISLGTNQSTEDAQDHHHFMLKHHCILGPCCCKEPLNALTHGDDTV